MAKTVSKIAYLDGIRGIAAFLVFFHHFLLAFYSAYYTFDMNASHLHGLEVRYGQNVLSVISNGNYCVCVFFVLSGFVLSRRYFQTQQFEIIVSGAQRRFLRLYIPVAATMIISFILMKAHLYYNVPVSVISHSEWWLGGQWIFDHPLQKLWHCLKVGTMFQGDSSFDTSLWTMAIELTGSMFVFAFLAFTHHTRNALFSLLLVIVYCKITDQSILLAFVLGIGLNYVEKYIDRVNRYVAIAGAIFLLLLGLVLGSLPTTGAVANTVFEHLPPFLAQAAGWYHTVGAFFLVLAFVMSPALQKMVSFRVCRFLGYISFSLYLLHPLIIGSFGCFIFLKIYPHYGYNHSVPVVFILTAIVCLALSWVMTRYVDDPGIAFSKYVYNRWIKKNPAAKQVEIPVNETNI